MKMTLPEISSALIAMVERAPIYTCRPPRMEDAAKWPVTIPLRSGVFSSVRLEFEQRWGLSASIQLHNVRVVDERVRYPEFRFDISVNVPAMNDELDTMHARMALLRQVMELADLINATLNGQETDALPKKEEVAK